MTLVFDGAGGVFDRIGAIYRFIEEIREVAAQTGTAGRWPYELNDLYVKVEGAANVIQEAVDVVPDAMRSAVSSAESLIAALQAAAQTILIEMADADNPLPERSVAEALRELVEQMEANTEHIAANTVSAVATPGGSNVGDGVLVVSVKDGRGRTLENVLAEDVLCQRDPTAAAFQCRGEAAASSKLAVNWPLGSGCVVSTTVVDAEDDGNLIANGGFDDFTVNVPDGGWTIAAGSAGTQILEETTNKLEGASALEFVGHATAADIRLDVTSQVDPRTPYAINLFYKLSGDPAAGVLTVDLYDGSAVIQDDAGTNNTMAVTLPDVNDTDWHALNATFRLPDPLPAQVLVRVRLSTALSVGTSLFIDQLAMVEADRLYDGGPYVAVFQGGTEFAADDVFTIAVANNRASLYQEACDVLFDTLESDVRIPTNGAPSITNSYPSYEGS